MLSKRLFGGSGEQLRVFGVVFVNATEEFVHGLVGWLLRLDGSSASVVQLNDIFSVDYLKKKL